MKQLEILVGPIASGKSTYCQEAAKAGAIIVNDDSLVKAIHGGVSGLYSKDLKPVYKAAENAIIHTALTMGLQVVVDRPNHSRAMRRRYIGLAKSLDCPVRIIMTRRESPEVHAARRYDNNPRGYSYEGWLKTALIHESEYESPCQSEEGFDELIHWEFSSQV